MIAITITEALVLTLTCLLAAHASELCVPFQNTGNVLQDLLFSRQFLSCSDVDFAQNRLICEVLIFSLIVKVEIIKLYHTKITVMADVENI